MPTLESLSSVGAPGSKRRAELDSLVGLIKQQVTTVERPLVDRAARERSNAPFPNPDLEFKAPRPACASCNRLYHLLIYIYIYEYIYILYEYIAFL